MNVLALILALAVPLRPGLPVELDAGWLQRLQIFPQAETVRFERAPWGGMVAVIDDTTLRAFTDSEWAALQARADSALTGGTVVPWPGPPPVTGGLHAWPEIPLADTAIAAPPPQAPAGYPPLSGRWQALLEAGVRDNVTSFDQFFTPMGTVGVGFGYPFSNHAAALLNFAAGFGDMRGDFEESFGDGRANTFAFDLGLLLRQPFSPRASFYVEVDGGYYIRSLMWGGVFYDPISGEYANGLVLEQQNWGGGLRAGVLLQRAHPNKPRFLDVGLGVQTTAADPWDFGTDTRRFTADGRDTWVSLTVRFWDAI